jgi:hypothetical protein
MTIDLGPHYVLSVYNLSQSGQRSHEANALIWQHSQSATEMEYVKRFYLSIKYES